MSTQQAADIRRMWANYYASSHISGYSRPAIALASMPRTKGGRK